MYCILLLDLDGKLFMAEFREVQVASSKLVVVITSLIEDTTILISV